MKKKVIYSAIITVAVVLAVWLQTNSSGYKDWKTINIEGTGSIKVPNHWVHTKSENSIILSSKPLLDNGCVIYLIQVMPSIENNQSYFANNIIGKASCKNISSVTVSNGATYGISDYSFGARTFRKRDIELIDDPSIYFIVWDDDINEYAVRRIAESYMSK